MATLGRVNEQQLQLFFLFQGQILAYKPEGFARLVDTDVALATGALATALETSSRGVIYDEPTASLVAEGLRRELKRTIDEVTKGGGSQAERQVAEVLRGIERGAKHGRPEADDSSSSYLELVGRILRQQTQPTKPAAPLIIAP